MRLVGWFVCYLVAANEFTEFSLHHMWHSTWGGSSGKKVLVVYSISLLPAPRDWVDHTCFLSDGTDYNGNTL